MPYAVSDLGAEWTDGAAGKPQKTTPTATVGDTHREEIVGLLFLGLALLLYAADLVVAQLLRRRDALVLAHLELATGRQELRVRA
jgi:hypothetical protein